MRTWHRWISLWFAAVLLWIAATGVLSQIVPLFGGGKPAVTSAAPAFVCPADYTCRPKPAPGSLRATVGLLHDLHSGKSFGPVGVVIGTLAGFALLFFAGSGLWLYIQMWRNRAARGLSPRWFWK